MIGIHFQKTLPEWETALPHFPRGTYHKTVSDQHLARTLHSYGQRAILRHLTSEDQTPLSTLEANKEKARRFFAQFIDGTFWEQELWRYIDAVEEWNEHIQAWPYEPETERRFLLWVQAVNEVWTDEYRKKYPDQLGNTPLVSLNIPVGNDCAVEFGRIIAKHNGIASYHGYTHFINGEMDPLDWPYHSGRWTEIDKMFVRSGIKVRWMSTEAGPYAGVYEGWRHPQVLNGSFERYLAVVQYQLDKISEWNAYNGGRFLGAQLFTFGRTGKWDWYELDVDHLKQIGDVVSAHKPVIEPPPPPPEPPDPPQDKPRGAPRVQYAREVWVAPDNFTEDEFAALARAAYRNKRTVGFSHDDAGVGDLYERTAVLFNVPDDEKPEYHKWYEKHYPGVVVEFDELYISGEPPEAPEIVNITDDLPKHTSKKYRKRDLSAITTLTIHHTVSPPDRAIESIAAYHVSGKDWPGIGYHFVIKDDGRIFQTNELTTKSYHAGTLNAPGDENLISVGIALQGDFTHAPPPQAQLDATRALVLYLRGLLSNIQYTKGHKEMPGAQTACPGATWPNWKNDVIR